MSKNNSIGIFNSFYQPQHRLVFRHLQVAVNGSDHQVKTGQYIIAINQTAVIEYITFDAFEYFKWLQLAVQFSNLLLLFPDPFFAEAIGIKSRSRVVGNDEVLK